ncbi:helix-turn-helix domain-containing protein [Fangia hongkongensis]|uniref:helix-turn-helix domain-containing protein n=1 Tax=Fangia hongkongensis TaxID=270495 RepID=UPI00037B9FAF|nr:AraC family transcriptional regulator [Fangia hongkongensis]MBK2126046.1 helix-turn-helix transcriptional regulator [Fangia hongkongensis]
MKEPIQFIDDSRLPLFAITEENQGAALDAHCHSKAQITYVEKGLMKIVVGQDIYLIPSGFLIYIPSKLVHSAEVQSQTTAHHLYLETDYTHELTNTALMLFASGLLKELIIKLTQMSLHNPDIDRAYLSVLRLELLSLQSEDVYRLSVPSHPRLQKVLEYINEHLNQPIQLQCVADYVHLSTRHLSRIFKQETGMSFSLWLQNYKLLIAIKRLAVVKMTSVVARELGYDSDSAFIHMFKRLSGGKKPSDFY